MMDEIALTFDDISIIPQYSEVLPSEVSTSVQLTPEIKLNVPIISAAMDTVTEYKMAIALAQLGGLGVIHKNMSIDEQTRQVRMVKRHDGGVVKDPITINGYHELNDVKALSEISGISSFPVVMDFTRYDSSKKILIGFLTARDIRFQTDDSITAEQIMTPYSQLVVATDDMSREEMKNLMYQFKVEKMPVVKMEGETPILRGLITMKDMEIMDKMPNATRDKERRLMVAAAVGVSEKEKERADELISAGVDALVVDSAHGHSKRVIDMVEWLKSEYPHIGIIAGNVVTAEGVDALYQAGANCVKVGIGPGCFVPGTRITTRSGMVSIEEVEEGTEVLTHRGRWQKVVGKSTFSDKKEVTSINGIESTTDHRYYVLHKRHCSSANDENLHSLAEWIEAKDLTKDYLLIKPKG
jgi:IMP dehydrogenase